MNHWQEYLNKMRELEIAVKLSAFWAKQTAEKARLAGYFAHETAENVKKFLNMRKVKDER